MVGLKRVLGASLLMAMLAPAAEAQDVDPVRLDKRVTRLEGEMRGVQRKVFPGSDGKYFEPEIAAPAAPPPAAIGTPASEPLIDLTQRVSALEGQLRTLTGQVEALQFKQRQLDDAQTRLKGDIEFRVGAIETRLGPAPGTVPPGGDPNAAAAPGALPAANPAKPPKPDAAPAKPATPDAAWKAAYAKALAKDWPATETAMSAFAADYPKSPRLSQAEYWLGRSHAERGQHAEAARAYLELYKTAPTSDRAPDALLGLAGSLTALKKPKDACRVLGELDQVYGAKLGKSQQAEAKTLRTRAKCEAGG